MDENIEWSELTEEASTLAREQHEPDEDLSQLEPIGDELPFAPPQLHRSAIRLRPIVDSMRVRPALTSGSAKLRALATGANQRVRARTARDQPAADVTELSDATAAIGSADQQRGRELFDRLSKRAMKELELGHYELRETWRDLGRLGRRVRRRRHNVRVGQEALARYRALGDHRREALELSALARTYRQQGQFREATVCYTQALTIFERLGNRRGECLSLSNLGLAHDAQGNRRKAVQCYEDALDLARMLRDRQIEGQVLANLGTAYSRQGRPREARDHWQRALALLTPGSSAHRQLSQHLG